MAGSDAVSSELSGAACLCTQGRTQSILDTDSLYKWQAMLLILGPMLEGISIGRPLQAQVLPAMPWHNCVKPRC